MAYAATLTDLFRLQAQYIWENVPYTVHCATSYIEEGVVYFGGWVISAVV